MGCLLSLMKFLLTIAFLIFIILLSILPSGCYKINCRCCFDYFCNYNFKEDILEVTYVASFYISKKM